METVARTAYSHSHMRRIVGLASGLAVISFVAIVFGAGATTVRATAATQITGTWTGKIDGSAAPSEQLTIKVKSGERKGTWSVSASCHGTLVLKDISKGFHHFNRIAATGASCSGGSGGGVDCLKRDGSRVLDEYAPAYSTGWNTGLLTRKH